MRRKSANRVRKGEKLTLTEAALQALKEAVAKVIEDHRRRGMPLAVWRNGKAVSVPADRLTQCNTVVHHRAKFRGH